MLRSYANLDGICGKAWLSLSMDGVRTLTERLVGSRSSSGPTALHEPHNRSQNVLRGTLS